MLAVGSFEVGEEVDAYLVQVANDSLALLTHIAEHRLGRLDVVRLHLLPVRHYDGRQRLVLIGKESADIFMT